MESKKIEKQGFIYILTNPAMPDLVKVGWTRRNPAQRIKDNDLTGTGVPSDFVIQYFAWFDEALAAEQKAHKLLAKHHYGKEFFKVDVQTAVHAIENTGHTFTRLHLDERFSDLAQQANDKEITSIARTNQNEDEARQQICRKPQQASDLFDEGRRHWQGANRKQDKKKAFELFIQAAELAHLPSQFVISAGYRTDETPLEHDIKASNYWLKKSAEQGYSESQYALGTFCYNGQEIDVDFEKAAHWLSLAANQGHEKAKIFIKKHDKEKSATLPTQPLVNNKQCPKCGRDVPDAAQYCMACWNQLDKPVNKPHSGGCLSVLLWIVFFVALFWFIGSQLYISATQV